MGYGLQVKELALKRAIDCPSRIIGENGEHISIWAVIFLYVLLGVHEICLHIFSQKLK